MAKGVYVEGGDYNNGLWDVAQALKWVQKEIPAFGGDREKVTLYGQSAGSDVVTSLLGSNQAHLFKQVIIISSPSTGTKTVHQNRDLTLEMSGSLRQALGLTH